MPSLVEMWMGEFAKLGKKKAGSAGSRNVESGGRRCTQQDGDGKEEIILAKQQAIRGEGRREVTLSEATMCLLMDRFAPS